MSHQNDQTVHEPTGDGDDGRDPMGPPAVPCECWCMHCHRTFMSDQIWFQKIIGGGKHLDGFWMCPTPNCSGAGFTFDIFPTDPDHPANEGWHWSDDEDDEAASEEFEPLDEWDESDEFDPFVKGGTEPAEYDPAEPKYAELDALHENWPDDDLEGEEWKYGLAPGERPEPPHGQSDWRAEEERRFNMPDERPRELDWTHRRREEKWDDDDIPF